MKNKYSYILSVLREGGNIRITTCIKLYDKSGNFVCCLSDKDFNAIRFKEGKSC